MKNQPIPSINKFPTLEELYSDAHRKKGNLSGTVAGCTGTLSGLALVLAEDIKFDNSEDGAKHALKTLNEVIEKLRKAREESY